MGRTFKYRLNSELWLQEETVSLSDVVRSRLILRFCGIIVVVAGLLVLPGCWVYSVEPLYEEDIFGADPDLVFDQSLVGAWGGRTTNALWILTITADDQAYD